MNNASPANATALPDRRRFLTAGAAAVASVAIPVAAVAATKDNQDDRAISLWEQRSALKPLFIEAQRAYREAKELLPWWAKEGPLYLDHDGTFSGPIVGWPAIQHLDPHTFALVMLRPGKHDYEMHAKMFHHSAEERANYLKVMRSELAERLRAQRSEKRRAGLLAANWALNALFEQLNTIDNQIDGLSSSTPNAAAVRVLREALFQAEIDDTVNESPEFLVALKALEFLRPHLRGIIKEHVADVLDNRGQRVRQCKAYLYEDRESEENSGKRAV